MKDVMRRARCGRHEVRIGRLDSGVLAVDTMLDSILQRRRLYAESRTAWSDYHAAVRAMWQERAT